MNSPRKPKRAARRSRHSPPAKPDAAPAIVAPPVTAAAAPARHGRAPALPAELDIRHARQIAEFLNAAIAAGTHEIDASAVATADTAGLQLLLAAGRMAAAHGRALRWQRASGALARAAVAIGVAGPLGLAGPE